ncbi:MAG TPA: hypothetical protein VG273_23745 [Bryobacteraceae bacterium]|jgi:hypothetical protein|nr:hypothetical protein [Bryobacteraceae bacterium]
MRVHLAILRSAALLVPEQQRAEWLAEWRSELWHAWPNRSAINLIAFCLGSFKDACWLRRHGPMPRSYGILHLDVPAPPAVAQSFPLPSTLHFLKSPAQCLSFLGALALVSIAVAFFLQPARDLMLASPYADVSGLLMISPWGEGNQAGIANGVVDPYPTVSVDQFRQWKTSPLPEFAGLAFYLPQTMQTDISPGPLSVARTNVDLFALLNISMHSNGPMNGLMLSNTLWRKHFHSDPHAVGRMVRVGAQTVRIAAILPSGQWKLPGHFDAWLIEDERDTGGLPLDARGFVLARLTEQARVDHGFPDGYLNYVWVAERNQSFLVGMLPLLLLGALLVPVTTFFSLGEYPARKIGLRRWLFLAAKIGLILPATLFAALDVACLGRHLLPVAAQLMLVSWVFALRWALIDQQRRCPICLRRLANPVTIGEPSRMLLEWHGTELMCPRGHGLLHVPDRPAIWFTQQRWTDFDPSWSGLFP